MKFHHILAASALVLGLAAPAVAQDAVSQDASCLVLSMAVAQSTDPAIKQSGEMAQSYFMGRLDARNVPNLSAILSAQVAAMTPARAKTENVRCSALIANRVKAMQNTLSQVKPQGGV